MNDHLNREMKKLKSKMDDSIAKAAEHQEKKIIDKFIDDQKEIINELKDQLTTDK